MIECIKSGQLIPVHWVSNSLENTSTWLIYFDYATFDFLLNRNKTHWSKNVFFGDFLFDIVLFCLSRVSADK